MNIRRFRYESHLADTQSTLMERMRLFGTTHVWLILATSNPLSWLKRTSPVGFWLANRQVDRRLPHPIGRIPSACGLRFHSASAQAHQGTSTHLSDLSDECQSMALLTAADGAESIERSQKMALNCQICHQFAAERFTWSSPTQNPICWASRELSIGLRLNEIRQ